MYYVVHLKFKLVSDVVKGNTALAMGGKKGKKPEVMLELRGSRNNSASKLYVGGGKQEILSGRVLTVTAVSSKHWSERM